VHFAEQVTLPNSQEFNSELFRISKNVQIPFPEQLLAQEAFITSHLPLFRLQCANTEQSSVLLQLAAIVNSVGDSSLHLVLLGTGKPTYLSDRHKPQVFGIDEHGSLFSNEQVGAEEQFTRLRIDVTIAIFCLIVSILEEVVA